MTSRVSNFLIIDDHPLYSKGLQVFLKTRSYTGTIDLASCAQEGKDIVRSVCPDIILMDISMENVNGVACTRLIKERWKRIKIVGMDRYDETHLVNEIVKAGAIGAINKSSPPKQFLKRLEVLLNLSHIDSDVSTIDVKHTLGNREIEVIKLLGKAMSSKQIADRLYISKSTVDNHRKRILKKTGLPNTAGVINWAIKNGVLDGDGN